MDGYKTEQAQYENDRKSAARFLKLVERYSNAEKMRKKEARKDGLHQNYLKRKANGKQKEYEERTKAKKKAQIDSQKEQIRAEDREKGIYFHAGVPNIPRAGKQAVM